MDLPQRPRQHVLESESRQTFAALVESRGWVVRALDSPDYGLDDHVEVFEGGAATGVVFYVQVRATDAIDLGAALRVRVRLQQQAYFEALGEPVLIVLYHARSQRLFGQWFHRVDPHPGEEVSPTIKIAEANELTAETIPLLAEEVRLVRTVRAALPQWPLQVAVRTSTAHSERSLAAAIAAAADDNVHFRFFVAGEASGPRVSVETQADRLIVHGGLASTTFHGDIAHSSVEELAVNAALGLAVALGSLGHADPASRLLVLVCTTASAFHGEILFRMGGILGRGGRTRDALAVGRSLAGIGRLDEAKLFVALVAMSATQMLTEDAEAVAAFNLDIAEQATNDGNTRGAAASLYSAGNWFFGRLHDYQSALSAYERTVELDPSYEDRSYYLGERAAALFECGQYQDAARWYERQLSMEEAPGTVARLADALTFAGRYEAAADVFRAYLVNPDATEPVWAVKAIAVDVILSTGLREQERNQQAAIADAEGAEQAAHSDERVRLCWSAIQKDALCSHAWHQIAAVAMNDRNDARSATGPLVVSAVIARDAAIWADAVLVSASTGEADLALKLALAALDDGEVRFLDAVRIATEQHGPDFQSLALELVESARSSLVPKKRGFTVRFHDGGELVEAWLGDDNAPYDA